MKTGKVKDRFPGWKPKKFPGQLPGETEVAARARMYQEKLVTKFKLDDAYVFGILKLDVEDWHGENLYREGELWLSPGGNHEELYYYAEENDIYDAGVDKKGRKFTNRKDYKFAGRLWLDKKIISFWDYPPKDEMRVFLDELEQKLEDQYELKVYISDDWQIDVKLENGLSELIPLGEYIGSEKRSEEEMNMQHVVSPLQKKGTAKERIPGWKPKKLKGQLPGETEVAARARMFQEKFKKSY